MSPEIILFIGIGLAVAAICGTVVACANDWGRYKPAPGGLTGFNIVAGIGAFICILIGCIGTFQRSYDHGVCKSFARQTGYTTKFVTYGNAWTWDCLVQVGDRWVSKDNLQLVQIGEH